MRDCVSHEVRTESELHEDPESVIRAAVKHVEMLAPNDQHAQAAILVAVQDLYWTTRISVREIRNAYLPGTPISAVWEIARLAELAESPSDDRRSASASRAKEQIFKSNYASRDVRIESESYEENPGSVTQAAVKYVEMLASKDKLAQAAILVAVQHLYWTTDISVSENRDAYAPVMPISAVVAIAGAAKLNIVCRCCNGSLYVTSRSSFKETHKGLSYCDRVTLWDVCRDCRGRITAEALLQCGYATNVREDERRNEDRPSTAAMPYRDYLQTGDWKYRRERALKRAKFSCQVCSGKGELHVHHRTYVRRGNEAEGDLIVLCATCHQLFHENGKLADGGRADV
jgi:5-methylcytosine-specific restriction endonuclease McrA